MDTANTMVADAKGLLAMDESNRTCNKRFATLGIPQVIEARRAYREMILTTPRVRLKNLGRINARARSLELVSKRRVTHE